jgi:hypothetical protein
LPIWFTPFPHASSLSAANLDDLGVACVLISHSNRQQFGSTHHKKYVHIILSSSLSNGLSLQTRQGVFIMMTDKPIELGADEIQQRVAPRR